MLYISNTSSHLHWCNYGQNPTKEHSWAESSLDFGFVLCLFSSCHTSVYLGDRLLGSAMQLLPFLLFVLRTEAYLLYFFLKKHIEVILVVLTGALISLNPLPVSFRRWSRWVCCCSIHSHVSRAVLPDMYPAAQHSSSPAHSTSSETLQHPSWLSSLLDFLWILPTTPHTNCM